MKSLKLDHRLAQDILSGEKTSTWRVNDDKDLHVNDQINLIDKVDPLNPATWVSIGTAIITTILEKQLGAVTKDDMDGHEVYSSVDAVIKEYQGYYGPQVTAETPVKIVRFRYIGPEEVEVLPGQVSRLKLYADGGSRGNPGPSASGFLLLDDKDEVVVQKGLFLGVTTNNQAEYQALKMGLEEALRRGVLAVDVFMDSMLVINQMKGEYKVKNTDLKAIHQSLVELIPKFQDITFTHVPRERNKLADAIVNQVLDTAQT